MTRPKPEPLLTSGEVARMYRVDPKTVARWERTGKLSCIRTLGGHRRFRESEVNALLQGGPPDLRYARPRAVPADDPAVLARLGLDGTVDL